MEKMDWAGFCKKLLPEGAVLKGISIASAREGDLFPEEKILADGYQGIRRQQFVAGRVLARLVLNKLGIQDVVLGQEPDGRVMVPEGIALSLSHCQDHCVVAAMKEAFSIGIDLELIGRVRSELWKKLFLSAEQSFLSQHTNASHLATALFCSQGSFL